MARTFHVADYVVFGLVLLISTVIGVGYGVYGIVKKKSAKEMLAGNRNMKPIPVSLSILAAFQAAPFVLGTPAEMYSFGTMYCALIIGAVLAVPVVAHIFIPILYNLNVVNGYQYFELRFNRTIKLISTALFCAMTFTYMAIVIYAPALAFSQVTGLSQVVSIAGMGLIATLYTAMGGLGAVIWIDVLQMMVILLGLLLMAIMGSIEVGGIEKVFEIADKNGRIRLDLFDPDPTMRVSFWTQSIGGVFLVFCVLGSNQAILQKYLSVSKLKHAQMTPYFVVVILTVFIGLVTILGLAMAAYYNDCDPLLNGQIKKYDQMVLIFMMDVLGHLHGIPGLFTSAVFCASLSTVAAGMNALSAVTLIEFVKPAYHFFSKGKEFSERALMILSKTITVVYGLAMIGGAFLAPLLGEALLQMSYSVLGTAGGPLTGILLLGCLVPSANAWGAGFGMLAGLSLGLWWNAASIVSGAGRAQAFAMMLPISVEGCDVQNVTTSNNTTITMTTEYVSPDYQTGAPISEPSYLWPYKISFMYYPLITTLTCFLVGLIVSLLTRKCSSSKVPVDPRLLFRPSISVPSFLKGSNLHDESEYKIQGKKYVSTIEHGTSNTSNREIIGVDNKAFVTDKEGSETTPI